MKVGEIVAWLKINKKQWDESLKKATGDLDKFGKKATQAGKSLTKGLTLPLVALGVVAVKSAVDINKAMANIGTLIPGNTKRLLELKDVMQKLGPTMGKSSIEMSEGAYQIISAFGDTADTVKKLEINTKAAAAGMSTVKEAIDLTSAVTKGYGDISIEATKKASDLAFKTVELGQTTFPELAASMGRVIPVAAAMNVSQEELFASMATLTGVTGKANEVSTQMSGILRAMIKPTDNMKKAIKNLGFSSADALIEQEGLIGGMRKLIGTTDGSKEAIGKLFRRAEALTAVFALTGGQADTFNVKLKKLKNASDATNKAFKEQTEGINKSGFSLAQLKAELGVASQKLGEVLLPIVLKITKALIPFIEKIGNLFKGFEKLSPFLKTIIGGFVALAASAGPVLYIGGKMINAFTKIKAGLQVLAPHLKNAGGGLTKMGKAGAVAGAAMAGWAVGSLIRKIKGVDEAVQSAATGMLKFLGVIKEVKILTGERLKQNSDYIKQIKTMGAALGVKHGRIMASVRAIQKNKEAYKSLDPELKKVIDSMIKKGNIHVANRPKVDVAKKGTDDLKNGLKKLNDELVDSESNIDGWALMWTEFVKVGMKKQRELADFTTQMKIAEKEARGEDFEAKKMQLELELAQEADRLTKKYEGHEGLKLALEALEEAHIAKMDALRDGEQQKKLDRIEKEKSRRKKLIDAIQKWALVGVKFAAKIAQLITNIKINAINRWYDKEKQAILNSTMSEEEKKKALEKLDKDYDAKKAAIQIGAAKREKGIAMMEAIVNTAAAIAKALPNLFLAAVAAAMGAAQIAVIASTPLPMAEGGAGWVDTPTTFLAGEAGREFVSFTPEEKTGGNNYTFNIYALDAEHLDEVIETRIIPKLEEAAKDEGFTLAPEAVR